MIKRNNYASLHNHTEYSNLKLIDSINTNETLIRRAWDLGLKAVAITDHDAVSGHHKAIKFFEKFITEKYEEYCKENREEVKELTYEQMSEILDFKLII